MDSIQDLIAKAQGGDRDAFEKLLAEHRSRLEALIGARFGAELRTVTSKDEVYQEAVYQAFRSLGRFEWRGDDSFMRWLGGIVENALRKAHRTREQNLKLHEQRLRLGPPVAEEVTPSRAMRREERFERLQASVARLSPEHREVLRLSRLERLPIADIARRMDRSEAAAKSLLARAIRELRKNFGATESLGLPQRGLGAEEGGDEE